MAKWDMQDSGVLSIMINNGLDIIDPFGYELDSIRIRAEENSRILKSTANGAKEARQRLKKIREADLTTGAYGANGSALRNPNASTITTKA